MRKNRRVLFLGNLAVAYNRDVLRGAAKYAASQPEIRIFFPDNFEMADFPKLIRGDICGVLTAGSPPAWRLSEEIAQRQLPAVDVSAEAPSSKLPRVITDDVAVGRMAANYFVDRGFRRLVYYGMENRYWSDARRDGFIAQANARGATAEYFHKQEQEAEDRQGIYPSAAVRWLKRLTTPVAVYAGDDLLGTYLIDACRRLKLKVPEEVAILGTDNDDLYGQLRAPHLSSILLDTYNIGFRAMALLYQIMRRRKLRTTQVLIPPLRVITRLSSDIFGVEDDLVREGLKMIHRNLKSGVSVKWLADQLAVSRPTMERHFVATLGRTPATEIQRIQMETARGLILDSDMPIARVAEEAGYSSPRQFSTSFHHYFDQTPRDMRKAKRLEDARSPEHSIGKQLSMVAPSRTVDRPFIRL